MRSYVSWRAPAGAAGCVRTSGDGGCPRGVGDPVAQRVGSGTVAFTALLGESCTSPEVFSRFLWGRS